MSLRYKVPQDVQREDKILFFITMKQLVVLMVTGGISYFLFVQLSETYILSQVAIGFIMLPFIAGCAFCFIRIKGLGLTQFFLLNIEHLLLPARRYWQPGSQSLVSSTVDFSTREKDQKDRAPNKNISSEKIKNLADLIDSGGKSARSND
jgi:hypothetical protein